MHSITDAEEALHWFWQGPKMSCREYQKKLIGLIEVYEHLGGEPRTTCRCVRQHMSKTVGARMDADPKYMPDPADLAAVKATARSSYITTILIIRSDKKRYGRLIANAQNDYMKGVPNTYLTTQHAAYEILLNWQSIDPPTQGHGKDSGDGSSMTFRQEEQDADGLSVRKKCTGQQGGGPKSTSQGSDNNSTNKPSAWPYGNLLIDPCYHMNMQEPVVCLTMDKDPCQTTGSFSTAAPPLTSSGTRSC